MFITHNNEYQSLTKIKPMLNFRENQVSFLPVDKNYEDLHRSLRYYL
ncbi:hypothetical protein IM45_311 [Candidatus Palibaumannia cicadellinicola]|uniref:Uncharacterized protein n=1 Tax=Candidatus Palibaumannia cicadellinicola TaxID=186490 RepID=A0A088NA57_9GAMM|nr:hypothetical protein IM45_311 [Candidatus Baumannia cicadellinicola]